MKVLKKVTHIMLCALCMGVFADSITYEINGVNGNRYFSDGWFAYNAKSGDDGAVEMGSTTPFLLSPEFSSSIRYIVLKVKCTTSSPSRHLVVSPFVSGIEDETKSVVVSSLTMDDEYEMVEVSFSGSDNVTAFRLSLKNVTSPYKGEWSIAEAYVFYGTASENEKDIVPLLVKKLKAPENLTMSDFSSSSISLVADDVAYAHSYKFSVRKKDTSDNFGYVETFSQAPAMSVWTREDVSAKTTYGTYTGASTTDGDKIALKIASGEMDFLSPVCAGPITKYSFMYKNGSSTEGLTSSIAVLGRKDESSQWQTLIEKFEFASDTDKHFINEVLSKEDGIKQIKIEIRAGANPSSTISLDSLSVFSEGTPVYGDEIVGESATPAYTFTNLESGIYEFKAQTISDPANEHFEDSDWSDLGEVDLHWCELDLSAPQNISSAISGEKLTLSWDPVKDAQYYLVDVFVSGIPTTYITQNVYTVSAALTVPVPELGEYEARVTAYGPFGKSQSEASLKGVEVVMSQVKNLKVNEVGETSFSVVWDEVVFAEGYQVEVFELSGETKDISSDYSKLPAAVGDSAGNEWKFDAYCMGENYADGDARFDYVDAYFETAIYPEAISQVKYAFEYSGSKDATWGEDSILLEGSKDGKEWVEIERIEVKEAKTSLVTEIATMNDFRALRFTLVSTGNTRPARGVAFSPVTITCGEIVETQIRDVKTQEKQYAIDGLRENGKYTLKVSPLPQGNADLSAKTPVIDLATAKPMSVNACSIASLYNNRYDENFSSLSDIVKATDIKNISLENWQMHRNGEAVSQVKFSAGGNPTASGIYVCSNSEKEEGSYSLGTLASADSECILGIAFSNDCLTAISDFSISFTAIQRTFKEAAKTLRLEYLITDKSANVSAEGDWKEINIPVTAPYTIENCGEMKSYENHIELAAINEIIPQGAMLLIRWRDEKRSKSPLMSIDNLTFKYTLTPSPTMIYLR